MGEIYFITIFPYRTIFPGRKATTDSQIAIHNVQIEEKNNFILK